MRRALLVIALIYSAILLASCQPSEAPQVPVSTTTIDCSVPCALPPLTVER